MLLGDCNQCGQCCVINGFTCQYLEITGELGQPQATRCKVYTQRQQGMPIMLWKGVQLMLGHCSKDSPEEEAAIIARGIGQGCSLVQIKGVNQ